VICTVDDHYVRDRARWVAVLDDGTTVFGDDDRPGVEPPSAWIRLGRHCREQGRSIKGLRVQFRSHIEELPPDMPGYFFARTAGGVVGAGTFQVAGFRVGWVEGDSVQTVHFKVPELTVIDRDERPIDTESEMLILN